MDNNLSKHVLELDDYAFGDSAPSSSWVLLNKVDSYSSEPGSIAAAAEPMEVTAVEAAD